MGIHCNIFPQNDYCLSKYSFLPAYIFNIHLHSTLPVFVFKNSVLYVRCLKAFLAQDRNCIYHISFPLALIYLYLSLLMFPVFRNHRYIKMFKIYCFAVGFLALFVLFPFFIPSIIYWLAFSQFTSPCLLIKYFKIVKLLHLFKWTN